MSAEGWDEKPFRIDDVGAEPPPPPPGALRPQPPPANPLGTRASAPAQASSFLDRIENAKLKPLDYLLCITLLGIPVGIVLALTGKPKGMTMFLISIILLYVWRLVYVAATISAKLPQ